MTGVQRAFQVVAGVNPEEDFSIVDTDGGHVVLQANEWDAESGLHLTSTLILHPSEARLLADMLTAHAGEAERRLRRGFC